MIWVVEVHSKFQLWICFQLIWKYYDDWCNDLIKSKRTEKSKFCFEYLSRYNIIDSRMLKSVSIIRYAYAHDALGPNPVLGLNNVIFPHIFIASLYASL